MNLPLLYWPSDRLVRKALVVTSTACNRCVWNVAAVRCRRWRREAPRLRQRASACACPRATAARKYSKDFKQWESLRPPVGLAARVVVALGAGGAGHLPRHGLKTAAAIGQQPQHLNKWLLSQTSLQTPFLLAKRPLPPHAVTPAQPRVRTFESLARRCGGEWNTGSRSFSMGQMSRD